ncbi:MAG: CRISPR-associated protein Csx15 [Dehalococcoidia bacterium]
MIILNFSHPLTPEQLQRIEGLTGQPLARVIEVRTQLDHEQPFGEQVRGLVDGIGLSPEQWQTMPLLINPPSLNLIAVTLLAELHGRMGYFPAVLRLRPVPGSNPPQYEVAEVINLQTVRDRARERR